MKSVENLLREGRLAEARETLAAHAPPERTSVVELARLAWRAGAPELGLRWLKPFLDDATPRERAEYAGCLIEIGAVDEAERWLANIDFPLHRALAHLARREFAQSIPLLKRHLTVSLEAYERAETKVSLASAYVFVGDFPRADFLLREILHEGSLRGFTRVLWKAIELTGEKFIAERRYEEADRFLGKAAEWLAQSGEGDDFTLRRYRAIVTWLREGDDVALHSLRAIRQEAVLRRDWECVRDCDRFEAVGHRDEALVHRLYFGTPFQTYRDVLTFDRRWRCDFPANLLWHPGLRDDRAGWIDLATGKLSNNSGEMKVGQAPHRLLATLASDFYRPFPAAALHEKLFPGEAYDPATSPSRVRLAVKRLGTWLDEHGVQLEIVNDETGFRLGPDSRTGIRISRTTEEIERHGLLVEKLRQACSDRAFSVAEASVVLSFSKSSALRILRQALQKGAVSREGQGAGTVYVFRKAG